jgi:hypothetical protein
VQISIIVTDDEGNTFQGETELARASKKSRKRAAKAEPSPAHTPVSFSSPIRAFMKKNSRAMGGPQKFALLLAYLAKGDGHKQVQLHEIQKQWNKMKGILGGEFNRAHSVRAKDHEWVDSPKQGAYVLLPGWKGIFNA